MLYQLEYTMRFKSSLRELRANERATVLDAIRDRLKYQAEEEATNRKQLRPNKMGIQWELRVGYLRVFYNVDGSIVYILLVAEKKGNEFYVGKERIEL